LTQPEILPTLPYAIFSTLQGAQEPTHESQPCKELKMPPHSLRTKLTKIYQQ
jgi:hypothetical protein